VASLKAVFFDVGETLVDEERYWREVAEAVGVRPHVLWAALGVTIARGEEHRQVFDYLGVEALPGAPAYYEPDDLYPDALPAIAGLRERGVFVGVAGNQSAELELWFAAQGWPVDYVASSARLGVRKPDPAFFEALVAAAGCEPAEAAYVGDRVDDDVLPARAARMLAVHVRRGPWGYLQDASPADIRVDSLAGLPEALGL
jgi:HAD superfamily hydrolase (TIGR01549 family)